MTEYKIIPDGLKAYGVEVAFPGRFLSVRGFATEREAAAWIAEQQAGEAALAAADADAPGVAQADRTASPFTPHATPP